MKKRILYWLCLILLVGCHSKQESQPLELAVDTLHVALFQSYDSEVLWNTIQKELFQTYSIQLVIHYYNDILQELDSLESICQSSDLVVGLNNIAFMEISDTLFYSYKSNNLISVDNNYIYDITHTYTPIGFHYLGLLYHSDLTESPPETFGHLQDKKWKEMLLMPNCETSSIGRAILYWSIALFENNGYQHFWRSIQANVFDFFDDYEVALSRFLIKESPFLMHLISGSEEKNTISYQIPIEGYFEFIEGAAISAKTTKEELAKFTLNLLLSEQIQELIASSGVLIPVHKKVLQQEGVGEFILPNFNVSKRLSVQRINMEKGIWLRQWKQIAKK